MYPPSKRTWLDGALLTGMLLAAGAGAAFAIEQGLVGAIVSVVVFAFFLTWATHRLDGGPR